MAGSSGATPAAAATVLLVVVLGGTGLAETASLSVNGGIEAAEALAGPAESLDGAGDSVGNVATVGVLLTFMDSRGTACDSIT